MLLRQDFGEETDRPWSLCIYERTEPEGTVTYEVISPRRQKEGTTVLGGAKINFVAKEIYPKAEQWGATERAVRTIEEAMKYFNEFSEKAKAA